MLLFLFTVGVAAVPVAALARRASQVIGALSTMYPKNAASPPPLAIGSIVQISDGAVQTTGVSARVKIGTGSWAAAANTPTCDTTSGIWEYTPSQAETNAESFQIALYKTGCMPAATTVVTSSSTTAGTVLLAPVTHTSAVIPTVTTTATATNLTNLPSIPANWLTAAGIASGALDGKGNWNIGKTGYSLTATTGLGNQTANITGNLSGSVGSVTRAVGSVTGAVGSVTGAVGSVTANVNAVLANTAHGGAAATLTLGGAGGLTATHTGNTTGSVGSVTGAVGSVTGNVGGNVTGSVGSVVGAVGSVTGLTVANLDAAVSSRMASYTQPTGFLAATFPGTVASPTNITAGTITTATNVTTVNGLAANVITAASLAADAGAEIADAVWDEALSGHATGGSAGAALSAANAPSAATVADAVWDEVLSGHLTAGSTGAALNAAGSAGDPWATALPGVYGSGTAGKIIGDNINATIGSRATQTSVDTIDGIVDSILVDTAEIGAAGAGLTALASAANLAEVKVHADAILADTNELQMAWVDGGRLDLILDARASQTSVDDLPTNAELATALGTADDAVLAQVALVKAKTDLIPAAPAAVGDIPSAATVADAVWDEALSGHSSAGTAGLALSDADMRGARTVVRGTVSSSTTPSVTQFTSSGLSPAGAAADQFKGRIIIFDNATTTPELRGQATDITASSAAANPLFTFTALTTAPVSGDTFSIV